MNELLADDLASKRAFNRYLEMSKLIVICDNGNFDTCHFFIPRNSFDSLKIYAIKQQNCVVTDETIRIGRTVLVQPQN
tara:strand:- start:483 stop:716 length:234 start_codon:yes stop_codon:yes gene_type:complete